MVALPGEESDGLGRASEIDEEVGRDHGGDRRSSCLRQQSFCELESGSGSGGDAGFCSHFAGLSCYRSGCDLCLKAGCILNQEISCFLWAIDCLDDAQL
jgi:hypothetical protein